MFPSKNWTLNGLKIVLSKIDATGSVERCSGSGRSRTARSPDTISDVQDLVLCGSEPRRLCGVGDHTRACVQASTDHGRGRAASVLRRNGTVRTRKWLTMPSVNGAATDSLRCSRQRTFWTFTLHITAFVHIPINVINLINFAEFCVKQINFSCTSNSLAVIVNFRFSQGSVAT